MVADAEEVGEFDYFGANYGWGVCGSMGPAGAEVALLLGWGDEERTSMGGGGCMGVAVLWGGGCCGAYVTWGSARYGCGGDEGGAGGCGGGHEGGPSDHSRAALADVFYRAGLAEGEVLSSWRMGSSSGAGG